MHRQNCGRDVFPADFPYPVDLVAVHELDISGEVVIAVSPSNYDDFNQANHYNPHGGAVPIHQLHYVHSCLKTTNHNTNQDTVFLIRMVKEGKISRHTNKTSQ